MNLKGQQGDEIRQYGNSLLKSAAAELAFWKEFVKTPRFLDGWVNPMVITPELNVDVANIIKDHYHEKVLDCGSGVVSILNGLVTPSKLTAADLLGDFYKSIFDYEHYNINPPLAIATEDLMRDNEFDIVHMSNALDHTQNPVSAFYRLLRNVKPGGLLILQGFENEGTFENWQGMHQHNLEMVQSPDPEGIWHFKLTDQSGNSQIFGYPGILGQETLKVEFTHRIQFESKTWFIWVAQRL